MGCSGRGERGRGAYGPPLEGWGWGSGGGGHLRLEGRRVLLGGQALPKIGPFIDVEFNALLRPDNEKLRVDVNPSDPDTAPIVLTVSEARTIAGAEKKSTEKVAFYRSDDDGGETEDKAAAETQSLLNTCGVTALCLDLIAPKRT